MTPFGIEPATFRFVAQHLNHCATAVPNETRSSYVKVNGKKAKFTLEQTTKAQRGSRGRALLFL